MEQDAIEPNRGSPGSLSDLNEPQARAVANTEGPLLVFAGAGSGKTRVITYRVAHLVATHMVPPYRILAVTFTNKAAGEMRERLNRLVGEEITRDLWVGTFHATCARLLRRYGSAVGLDRNFLIYDDADQRAVVNRVLKELDLDDRRYPTRMVLSRIHKEKQEGRAPSEMVLRDWTDDQVVKLYERYEAHLKAANAVDFEDLILRMTRIAESDSDEGEDLRRRFRYVLVDEFQDTNHIQYRLVRQLVRNHHNLCVVGDDDQSIYRWRGADIRNIRGFKHDFPEAEVVKLEQNYRSTARIVRAALAVIKPSKEREPKELWTANDDGAKVMMVSTSDERDEAAHVVQRIRELMRSGVSLQEIAVFYRVHAQSRVLEDVMRAEKIP
ncbi:MAG: UvrD-helicase domain-containing protein, partial [Polyangiaceae bacterium]